MAKERDVAGGKSMGVDDAMVRLTGAQLVRGTASGIASALASAGAKLRGFGVRNGAGPPASRGRSRNVRPDAVLASTGERRELTSLRFLHLSDEQIPKRLEGWGCEAMCTTLGTPNRREPGPWAAHTIEGDVHDHLGALSEVAGRFLRVVMAASELVLASSPIRL
jgi:hypothetical protein